MRIFVFWFLILWSAAALAQAPVDPAADARRQEAGRLIAEVTALVGQGRYAEARPAAERSVALVEAIVGADAVQLAEPLSLLGEIERMIGHMPRALELEERALQLYERHGATDNAWAATCMYRLADLQRVLGNHAQALALQRRVEGVYSRIQPVDNVALGTSLNSQAELQRLLGHAADAEPLHARAVALYAAALGTEHAYYGSALQAQATTWQALGAYEKARPGFERALAIFEKTMGPKHFWTAAALNNLAELDRLTARYREAEPLYRRALAVYEAALGPRHAFVASVLHNLAFLLEEINEFAQAEKLLQRALAIEREVYGAEHPDVATTLRHLGDEARRRADFPLADKLLHQALAMREKLAGLEHPDLVGDLESLVALALERGDYAGVEPLCRRGLEIAQQSGRGEATEAVQMWKGLAHVYAAMGDPARARPLLEQVLELQRKRLGPQHPAIGDTLHDLADLRYKLGDAAGAETLHRAALAIREAAFGPLHTRVANSLNDLAAALYAQGRTQESLALLQRALRIDEQLRGPRSNDVAVDLHNLAMHEVRRGRWNEALALMRRALATEIAVLGSQHPHVATTQVHLAEILEAKGDLPAALALRRLALQGQERSAAALLWTGSEDQKAAVLQQWTADTWTTLSHHARLAPKNPDAARLALETLLRRKGRAVDAMGDVLGAVRRGLGAAERQQLERLVTLRTQLASRTLAGPGAGDAQRHQAELAALQADIDTREADLSRKSAGLAELRAPVTLAAVQAALPADAALVEFAYYRPFDPKARDLEATWEAPRYLVYVLRKTGAPAFADLGAADAVEADAAALRKALASAKRGDATAEMRAADRRILEPVRALVGDARHLLLAPDGALHLLPFAALLGADGKTALERNQLTWLASGRDLLRLRTTGADAGQAPLVLADPDFDEDGAPPRTAAGPASRSADLSRLRYPPLPGTAQEAEALRSLLPGASILTGARATEAALKAVHGPRTLHIATHGFFLADAVVPVPDASALSAAPLHIDNPLLRSGLALAGFNLRRSGGEDGVLTALEAAALDLRGTRLVVLSACSTGVGEIRNGDGVHGLRRAFAMAGAETLIMSLWGVDDEATRDLMVALYQGLAAGKGRSQALRDAQLGLLHGAHPHPHDWAAFIAAGDWRP